MELGLSLGEASGMGRQLCMGEKAAGRPSTGLELGFSMGLGLGFGRREEGERGSEGDEEGEEREARGSAEPPVQLDLLPLAPVPRQTASQLGFPWPPESRNSDASARGFDVNRAPAAEEEASAAAAPVSPSSAVPSFQMDFAVHRGGAPAAEVERASSRGSDEEENGLARKKLRLSKEQSAFLEESFKEHNTLNPKQKLALAKQLNLRPRQVEVWFQNRRARTKLKQTEVDCEYLKRCCETLTEENRRLHKELAELRALKAAAHPFFSHLPATTLSMCPSCERTTATSSANPATAAANSATPAAAANSDRNPPHSMPSKPTATPFTSFISSRPRFFPFAPHPAPPHQPSAAS